ncbi:capsule assembly Wzi family protein [Runella sp. MFBS21]|uniref:capsule assembly Wzi family protein n=1 Tax=Runella sp. MFBS21 TaxID=3034018 RepID=UPI0023F6FB89|nr:capsule assembly Wzi family protein [Runella sp. MFBS21]MDF7822096.1 capsule assembly Wzi family protein [Runella sp. MFBS21]
MPIKFLQPLPILIIIFYIELNSYKAHAQLITFGRPHYQAEVKTTLASQRAPFWLYANTFGTVSTTAPNALFNVSLYSPTSDSLLPNWRNINVNYGVETYLSTHKNGTETFLVEGYTSIKYGIFRILAGRKREVIGLIGDSLLTSGSFAMSGNTLPIPQIKLTSNFVVPFTNKLIAIKACFSYGWLGSMAVGYGGQGVTSVNGLFHQKNLYATIGKPQSRFQATIGFNHQVQWGGENQIWPNGLSPTEAWWGVVLGKSWMGSRVGNHLGTIDMGLKWKLQQGELFLYRQNIYEDGSLYAFLNIGDGLNGVVYRPVQQSENAFSVKSMLFEFLNTTSQGGDVFNLSTGVFGKDNYFNHYVYTNGWSYNRKTIGTPFIAPQSDLNSRWPHLKNSLTNNNRVKLLHLGASGQYLDCHWFLKTSFSINYGLYDYPLIGNPKQFSSILQVQKSLSWLGGIEWSTALGIDVGRLYKSSVAIQLGLRKRGNF